MIVLEAKQRGTLFHFTSLWALNLLIEGGFKLISDRGYISFTRNPFLIDRDFYDNEFSFSLGYSHPKQVAIMVDGDKLSDRFRITPFLDLENDVVRSQGENEERVVLKKSSVDILRYIKKIVVIINNKKDIDSVSFLDKKMCEKNYPFRIEAINSIKSIKSSYL